METLNLNLIKKWFDMTLSGEKKEEYRCINTFWIRRLTKLNGSDESVGFWHSKSMLSKNAHLFKTFDINRLMNGMAKNAPVFKIEHKGIRIGTGNAEWGAEPGKEYFIISHGAILETKNIK